MTDMIVYLAGLGNASKSEVELRLRVEVLYLLIAGEKFLVVGLAF